MAGTPMGLRGWRRRFARKFLFASVSVIVCFALSGNHRYTGSEDDKSSSFRRRLLSAEETPSVSGGSRENGSKPEKELDSDEEVTRSPEVTFRPHRHIDRPTERPVSDHESDFEHAREPSHEDTDMGLKTSMEEGEEEEEEEEEVRPSKESGEVSPSSTDHEDVDGRIQGKAHAVQPTLRPKHSSSARTTTTEPTGPEVESTPSPGDKEVTVTGTEECTRPAYHEFPPDLFTESQRSHGAVIVHILVIMYMFYAVAVVCDEYFIASLDECCNRLQLSEDVAGATFMAAGSSAPELFTAILGVLVAKGDVGTGTIVGSAVFNVLFVIGICGIFAGRVVELTWWPLFRDSTFYSLTVIILIVIIFDSEVTWYESVIMMAVYSLYIVIMKFSNELHMWTSRRFGIEEDSSSAALGILEQGDKKNYSSYVPFNNEIDDCAVTARYHTQRPPADESIRDSRGNTRLSLYDAALQIMMTRHFRPKSRFRAAAFRVMLEHERRRKEDAEWSAGNKVQPQLSIESTDLTKWKAKTFSTTIGGDTSELTWKKLPKLEDGILAIIKWIIQAPLLAVLYYTIPNCKKDHLRKFFLLTFTISITWTAVFSYVMVWMVTLVGYTLGIPDSIMGITFLAAGTSVPDAFASLIVARQGQGDMAVSNSIGSNVFDILIGLAFPWFIQTALVEPGSIATINSRGMVYSVILLFLTILVTIGGIFLSHWQLTPRLGVVLLFVYAIFLVISSLLEFNLLGDVNPPMCPD